MTEYQKCTTCGKWTNTKEIDVFVDDPAASLCRICSMAKREAEDPPEKKIMAVAVAVLEKALKAPAEKKVQEKRKKKGKGP